jgi:small-conductance mechanosensitive channel
MNPLSATVKAALSPTGQRPASFLDNLTLINLLLITAVFGLVWLALHYITIGFNHVSRVRPRMRFLIGLTVPVLRLVLWFSAVFFGIEILAPTTDAMLAALGSAAIAIGLGAQDLIKNLIGGLVIVTDRPYQLGDRVTIGTAYGEVRKIGLLSTKILTFDDTQVTISNSEVLSSFVFNNNFGVPECMIVTEVMLPPEIDPDMALRVGWEALLCSQFAMLSQPHGVSLRDRFDQAPYTMLSIRAYVYDNRYELQFRTDLTSRCKRDFIRLGVYEQWRGLPAPQ